MIFADEVEYQRILDGISPGTMKLSGQPLDLACSQVVAAWNDRIIGIGSTVRIGLTTELVPARSLEVNLRFYYALEGGSWEYFMEVGVELDTVDVLEADPKLGVDPVQVLVIGSSGVLSELLGGDVVGLCGISHLSLPSVELGAHRAKVEAPHSVDVGIFCVGTVTDASTVSLSASDRLICRIDASQ